MAKDKGVLPLDSNELDSRAKIVQDLILKDKEFLSDIRDSSGKLQHNDIMTIRPAIISTMDKKIQDICKNNTCYQAIKYNFVTDTTTRAI